MIDEKLKELFNKLPHVKENKPLQNTLSKKISNLIKKEIQHGTSQVEAGQKVLLNLTDLDTLSLQLKNLEETDYSKYSDFFARIFDSKLVNELSLELDQIDEIHLNYRLDDILILPANSSDLTVHDFMSRDIENFHSTVEKVGNVLKIAQGPRKLVGIFKNKTLLLLPKGFTGFLTIRSQSGDVHINKATNHCLLGVTAVSGDLLLARPKLKRVQADLKSGDIAVSSTPANAFHTNVHSGILTSDHVCAEEEISYHTSSGNIDLDNISTKNSFIDTKSGKITINDLNGERMDLVTDTGDMSLDNIKGSGDIKLGTGRVNSPTADKPSSSSSVKSRIGGIRVNAPRTELFKFEINTKKIGLTDLPFDFIIHDSNEYDETEGYVGDENSSNSLIITSEIGKAPIKN